MSEVIQGLFPLPITYHKPIEVYAIATEIRTGYDVEIEYVGETHVIYRRQGANVLESTSLYHFKRLFKEHG